MSSFIFGVCAKLHAATAFSLWSSSSCHSSVVLLLLHCVLVHLLVLGSAWTHLGFLSLSDMKRLIEGCEETWQGLLSYRLDWNVLKIGLLALLNFIPLIIHIHKIAVISVLKSIFSLCLSDILLESCGWFMREGGTTAAYPTTTPACSLFYRLAWKTYISLVHQITLLGMCIINYTYVIASYSY